MISPIGTGVCCHNMRLLMCTSVYKDHTLGQTHHSRRWLPTHKKQSLYHHEQGKHTNLCIVNFMTEFAVKFGTSW